MRRARCDTCGALEGRPCLTKSGKQTTPHKGRRILDVERKHFDEGEPEEPDVSTAASADPLDDARRWLRNLTFGWSDPTVDIVEIVRSVVEALDERYYTVEQWDDREAAHEAELVEAASLSEGFRRERDEALALLARTEAKIVPPPLETAPTISSVVSDAVVSVLEDLGEEVDDVARDVAHRVGQRAHAWICEHNLHNPRDRS